MYRIFIILFLFIFLSDANANEKVYRSPIRITSERPIPAKEWNDNVKLWLARSCAGEAGFNAVEECIGIAWVYATRWRTASNMSFLKMVKRYSAAIKQRSTHTRRWILNLNLKGERPVGWPERLKWSNHKKYWKQILIALDEWSIGKKTNPVLGADHFGGSMDTPGSLWVRVYPTNGMKFKNRFYRSPSAPPIEVD